MQTTPPIKSPLLGAIAGGAIGAILRSTIAAVFLWYTGGAPDDMFWRLIAVSGLIGLAIGGSAGCTCNPVLGSVLGGILSGSSCILLAILPMAVLNAMSNRHEPNPNENLPIFIGFFAMVLAGIVSGGHGAQIGCRPWAKKQKIL
jgi:hypothetical protein